MIPVMMKARPLSPLFISTASPAQNFYFKRSIKIYSIVEVFITQYLMRIIFFKVFEIESNF
jgi:hypothetical protein